MIFSEKHELVRKLARDFAEKELTKDVLDQIEETSQYPKELLDKLAKAGFFGIKTPVEYGGQGSDYLSYVITMEELARASAVTTIWTSAPNSLGGGPLMLAGTPEQLEKYLTPVAKGEKILAFGLTEPNAGSDAGRHDHNGCARRRLLGVKRTQKRLSRQPPLPTGALFMQKRICHRRDPRAFPLLLWT